VTQYVKLERVSLKNHPELDERWVQARIAEDPAILGLGELVLKDKERIQPRAGRLDLLLQDPDTSRYEIGLVRRICGSLNFRQAYQALDRKGVPQRGVVVCCAAFPP
jgi:hypothetical protein